MTAEEAKKVMFRDYPDVVDSKQLGEMLGISKCTVNRILRSGRIKCFIIGGRYRIPKINVLEYMGYGIK